MFRSFEANSGTIQRKREMFKKHALAEAGGRPARPQGFPAFVAKGYFDGVALARGAYTEYVSTPKARERSWLVCRSLGEGWRPPASARACFFNISRKGSEDLATSSTPAIDQSNLGQAPSVLTSEIPLHSVRGKSLP